VSSGTLSLYSLAHYCNLCSRSVVCFSVAPARCKNGLVSKNMRGRFFIIAWSWRENFPNVSECSKVFVMRRIWRAVVRPHRMHVMRTTATDDPVSRCVCQSVTSLRHAETAERIGVLFGWILGPRIIALSGGADTGYSTWGAGDIRFDHRQITLGIRWGYVYFRIRTFPIVKRPTGHCDLRAWLVLSQQVVTVSDVN